MSEISTKFPGNIRICQGAAILRMGLLLILSALSACAAPPPETKQAQTSGSLRQNYCLGNVASLGTGLAQSPIPAETKYSTNKARRWTGWVRASASGKYEFSLPDSRGRIIVNQQQMFTRAMVSSKRDVVQIELLTNRFYAITVETLNSEDSKLSLQWRRPDGRQETIPKAYLYAPIATAEPAQFI